MADKSTSPGCAPAARVRVERHIGRLSAVLEPALARRNTRVLSLEVDSCAGATSTAEVRAPGPLPGFDNSQMDGFAVRCSDLQPGSDRLIPLAGTVPAGSAAPQLPEGECLAVMTGAPVPEGADAVIPVEASSAGFTVLEALGRGESVRVRFTELTAEDLVPGRFIRAAGSDVAAGDTVLRPGDQLTPARLGLLAACGVSEVSVLEPIRTLVLATGEEIRGPGEPLGPGQLYDANTVLIRAACEGFGHRVFAARVPIDNPEEFDAALDTLAAQHRPHLIVTAGGISAGAYEVVRQALNSRGVQFGSVAQQPGGPQGWGSLSAEHGPVAVIALPGNPVSCAVSLEVLLRPALTALDPGCPDQRRVPVRLAEPLVSPRGLRQFRRVQLAAGQTAALPAAVPVGGPSSHLLGHLARSDALLEIPEDMVEIPAGTPLEAILL